MAREQVLTATHKGDRYGTYAVCGPARRGIQVRVLTLALFFCLPCWASGVRVKAERVEGGSKITSWGSACFVEKNKVLTAYHVVDTGSPFVEVKGSWLKCTILKIDKKHDLALLECELANEQPVELVSIPALTLSGSSRAAEVRDRSVRIVSAWIEGDVDDGDSGSPVFADEKLIGIFVQRSNDKKSGTFITANIIAEFLK